MQILDATIDDWSQIRAIYREGILTNDATFNTVEDIPSRKDWFAGKLAGFILKAVDDDGEMLGWGTLSPTSSRRVYSGVVEDSVYVTASAGGRGIGKALLAELIKRSDAANHWTMIASIFPENGASVHIHKQAGFRIVGRREKIAQMHGQWRDVVWMERRSSFE